MTSGAKIIPVLLLGLRTGLRRGGSERSGDPRGCGWRSTAAARSSSSSIPGAAGITPRRAAPAISSGSRAADAELEPTGLRAGHDVWSFAFEGGIELRVRVAQKADYLRFELVKALRPEKIEAVLWGPIRTADRGDDRRGRRQCGAAAMPSGSRP